MSGRYGLCDAFGLRPREGLGRGRSVKKSPRPAAVGSDMESTALNLPLAPQTLAKPRGACFASHLTLYICVVLSLRSLPTPSGRGPGASLPARPTDTAPIGISLIALQRIMATTSMERSGSAWSLRSILRARRTCCFSAIAACKRPSRRPATADWFSAASARYYLMGFSYGEHVSFAETLLGKMHPQSFGLRDRHR